MFIDSQNYPTRQFSGLQLNSSPAAELVFVGPSYRFTDCLISATAGALGVALKRLDGMRDLAALKGDEGSPIRLAVFDEATAAELTGDGNEDDTALSNTNGAVAYCSEDAVRSMLAGKPAHPWLQNCLPMDLRFDVWVSVLQLLLHGGRYVAPELMGDKASLEPANDAANRTATPDDAIANLTPREMDVLERIAQGHANKVIASQLRLSEHTVKLHVHNLISKLGVSNRTEAALRFSGRG